MSYKPRTLCSLECECNCNHKQIIFPSPKMKLKYLIDSFLPEKCIKTILFYFLEQNKEDSKLIVINVQRGSGDDACL